MKRILLSVAVLTSAFLLVFAQGKKNSTPAEETVLKLEQQWEDALIRSDIGALEKLYDDTIVYTHSNGKVDTKSSYLNAIKSGATKYESMKRDEIKVTVYGPAATVPAIGMFTFPRAATRSILTPATCTFKSSKKTAGNWWRTSRRASRPDWSQLVSNPARASANGRRPESLSSLGSDF